MLFVHIPKTGGTSVGRLVKHLGGKEALRRSVANPDLPCTPQHFHASILPDIVPLDFVDLAFTVVRNPYERLASEYRMRVQQPGRDLPFDEFVRRMFQRFERNPFIGDNHIRPQSHFLLPGVRQFRFEESPFDAIASALEEIGVANQVEMPWERKAERQAIASSPETIGTIRAFYADDFTNLDYSPDNLGESLQLR